ncbi:hypothetical protein T440DRAFT_544209 [Plenodomus tracheiphilus IPT5]|uniref:Uncharacterized protein n=1 Tax=Plenodomus tracheiphilus IPT5 TaxID=1408161 RepID=A0A6A7BI51_9PLEO|nr:hypothetical protein T440DRAFT_544209 [Plenodomus tracheiphilus IPT5]
MGLQTGNQRPWRSSAPCRGRPRVSASQSLQGGSVAAVAPVSPPGLPPGLLEPTCLDVPPGPETKQTVAHAPAQLSASESARNRRHDGALRDSCCWRRCTSTSVLVRGAPAHPIDDSAPRPFLPRWRLSIAPPTRHSPFPFHRSHDACPCRASFRLEQHCLDCVRAFPHCTIPHVVTATAKFCPPPPNTAPGQHLGTHDDSVLSTQ